jgi:GDP/GTP exchange factor required for growth at low temperature
MPSRSSQSTGTTKSNGSSGPTKRRSRMSMHTFLPPTMFKNSHASTSTLPKISAPNTIPPPPLPPSHQHVIVSPAPGPSPQLVNEPANSLPNRRLRRARSLSNMFGMANPQNPHIGVIPSNPPPQIVQGPTIPNYAVGRPHAHSVTGADIPRPTLQHSDIVTTMTTGLASMGSISSRIQPLPPPPTRDVFSDVMGWNAETFSETGSCDDSSNYGSGYGGGYGGFVGNPT